ncbi:MAG: hypothetical protein R2737_14935 [Candidatus Nanopelagicales bacterium]
MTDEQAAAALAAAEHRAIAAEHEVLRERDKALGLLARLGHMQWELEHQRQRAEQAERQLREVQTSLRYRVGRAVVSPGTLYRSVKGRQGA